MKRKIMYCAVMILSGKHVVQAWLGDSHSPHKKSPAELLVICADATDAHVVILHVDGR